MESLCARQDINGNLEELRELIKHPPAIFEHLIVEDREDFQVLDMENGKKAFIYDAWHRDKEISVTVNYSPPDTTFPRHIHPAWEVFVIWHGEMRLKIDNREEEILIKPPGSAYVPAGIGHLAYFPVGSWYLAITIPPDPSWPGVRDDGK